MINHMAKKIHIHNIRVIIPPYINNTSTGLLKYSLAKVVLPLVDDFGRKANITVRPRRQGASRTTFQPSGKAGNPVCASISGKV